MFRDSINTLQDRNKETLHLSRVIEISSSETYLQQLSRSFSKHGFLYNRREGVQKYVYTNEMY